MGATQVAIFGSRPANVVPVSNIDAQSHIRIINSISQSALNALQRNNF